MTSLEPASPLSSTLPIPRIHEGSSQETPEFIALRSRVALTLQSQATALARRWERQARSVALRDEERDSGPDADETVVALIHAFAAALASDGAVTDDGVALGLAFGIEAFEARASLHHTLKGLDLLTAMTMYAVEGAVASDTAALATTTAGVADGVRLCRRLLQATSLVTLAVTKGYTQAVSDGLRDRFRHLRHDLRNPLGTIKSVLALMDDETVPEDARAHPRFRAMATRNARSLDELIVDRLSDTAALLPSLSHQRVSLRVIACGVRRDLRAEAEARDTSVLVSDARVRVCVDAVSLELLLHTVLHAMLQEASEGDEVMIEFGEPSRDRATLQLTRHGRTGRLLDDDAVARIGSLASRMGVKLAVDDAVHLSVPIRADESDAPHLVREDPPPAVEAPVMDK